MRNRGMGGERGGKRSDGGDGFVCREDFTVCRVTESKGRHFEFTAALVKFNRGAVFSSLQSECLLTSEAGRIQRCSSAPKEFEGILQTGIQPLAAGVRLSVCYCAITHPKSREEPSFNG